MPRHWSFHPHDSVAVRRLSSQLRVSPLLAQILIARGLGDPAKAAAFLRPSLQQMHDPALLPGVSEAAERIISAIRSNRRITIYGDYDVDGVTSTSLIWHCLQLCDATVDYYIPCRMEEGYGLNSKALRQLHEDDPNRLLISVDCGIASVEEAALARELGLELIITDHHHIGDQLPDAAVVVHPGLNDGSYPFADLCGAGVALKLAWEICRKLGDGKRATPRMRNYLMSAVGLAAIGTVADVVPLLDENRAIVRYGLAGVREHAPAGFVALLKAAELFEKEEIRSDDIAFGLAPRINAAGRLGQARLAVELLTTEQADRAVMLAQHLDKLNKDRKTVERRILKQAKEQVEEHPEWSDHKTLVLAHRDWHQGVVGIVASRMTELYEKPTVMISLREDGTGHGSARSFAGFRLYDALHACRETLDGYGGHQAAAGVRVSESLLDDFRGSLANWAEKHYAPTVEETALRIDAEVLLSEVTLPAVRELEKLGPFGAANPTPRFVCNGVTLAEPPRTMGEGDRHISIRVRQHKTTLRAVAFGRGDWHEALSKVTGPLAISFAPVINSFRGYDRVELHLSDWKEADAVSRAS